MITNVPAGELAALAALIIAAGVVTGILAGLFGIGGGALIVPVLYEVFGALGVPEAVRFQLCVGTSLAIIVPTTVLSVLTHRGKGAVMMDVVRVWTVPAVAGVALGSAAAAFASAAVLKIAFILVGSVIACKLLLGRDSWQIAGRSGPRRHDRLRRLRRARRLPDGHQRRLDPQHDPHPARQADPRRGGDLGRLGCRSRSPAPSATCSRACRSRR